jgi:hypothetical protein
MHTAEKILLPQPLTFGGDYRDIGRTKAQVLRKIREEFAISDIPCDELRPRDITDLRYS